MRFLHILIILILIFFSHEFVFAQNSTDRRVQPATNRPQPSANSSGTTSRSSAIKDNLVQAGAGLAGIAAGTYLAQATCNNPSTAMMCQMGIMMGVQSVATVLAAPRNTKPSSDALSAGNYGSICDSDPSLCAGGDSPGGSNFDFTNDPIIDDFRSFARTQGVDIDDPASVDKFMKEAAENMDGAAAANMKMPASVAAKVEQFKKQFESKYKVSSVELEGGGGGRFPSSTKGSKDLDFNSLLEGLNPKEKTEGSVDGLQRKLASGEPVGVASDNIFKQISRRYQAKRDANIFIK